MEGVRGLLETAFGTAFMVGDEASLIDGVERLQPSVTVVDLALAGGNWLQLLQTLRERSPAPKVIVLSMYDEFSVVDPPRPAARAIRSLKAEQAYGDRVHRPYLHLVDGGVSDNVGMRSVLDALEILEALHEAGRPTPLDSARRIIVFVVNSLSSPPTNWDESENPPGTVDILLKSAGTPIDAFSFETTELLRDTAARWRTMRLTRVEVRLPNQSASHDAASTHAASVASRWNALTFSLLATFALLSARCSSSIVLS